MLVIETHNTYKVVIKWTVPWYSFCNKFTHQYIIHKRKIGVKNCYEQHMNVLFYATLRCWNIPKV